MGDYSEGSSNCFELKPSSTLRKLPSIDSEDNYDSDDSYTDDSPNISSTTDPLDEVVGIPIPIHPTIVPADEKLNSSNNNQINSKEMITPEVMLIKEIVPNLDTQVIFQILQKNKFNIDLSIDASLALYATMEAEEGKILTNQKNISSTKQEKVNDTKILSNENNTNKIRLINPSNLVGEPIRSVPQTYATINNSQQSRRISISIDNSNIERNVNSAHLTQRGIPRLLPEDFLAAPRFKLTIDKKTDLYTDYSIQFRRTSEKLGITISEVDGEIIIYTLHTKSNGAPLLAQDAGVNVGDILIGIDNDYFSQGAEVQDVLDLLGSTGSYVNLHFTRRHSNHVNTFNDANEHRFAQILHEQQVIPVERMYNVGCSLIRLRDRVIQWNDANYTIDGNNKKRPVLVGVDGHATNNTNTNTTFDPFQMLSSGRSSFTVTSTRSTSITNTTRPLSFKTDTAIDSKNLRPGLSVRIMRAEERIDHVVYVIWVQDVKTAYEWVVRRRFREFNDFRDCLVGIKSTIGRFDFPPKRLSITETAAVVNERLNSLQKFIRKISSIACNNSSHPSTTRVQAALHYFLDIHDHIDNIQILEMTSISPVRDMTQVFIHSVLQLSIMDKVLCGFIDNFIEESSKDNEVKWNDIEVRKVLSNVRDFIDNLQAVFSDGLHNDCVKIINKFLNDETMSIKQLQDKIDQESLELIEGSNQQVKYNEEARNLRRMIQQSIDRREKDLIFINNNSDEIANIAKIAIRRQLEVEIYAPCILRLSNLLYKILHSNEQELQRKISLIYDQPQQFFGIPVKHTSPSNWSKVVTLLGTIRMKTLPYDRLELLLKVAKEIPLLFVEEHPGSEKLLGADEFLPIFIYILVRSKIVDLLALNEELQAFCDPDKKLSETGYYMATLEASIQHILDADIDNGLGEVLFPTTPLAHTFTEDQWDDDTDSDDSVALENKESDILNNLSDPGSSSSSPRKNKVKN